MRRAVLLCLAGAALLLLAMSRAWVSYRLGGPSPLPTRTVSASGAQLVPGVRALGLVGLAGMAALPAARSYGRLLVGALLAMAGTGAVVAVVRVLVHPRPAVLRTVSDVAVTDRVGLGAWPYVAVLGGLLVASAGLLAILRGRSWSALGTRYDAPAVPKQGSLWDALDRGDDPTA